MTLYIRQYTVISVKTYATPMRCVQKRFTDRVYSFFFVYIHNIRPRICQNIQIIHQPTTGSPFSKRIITLHKELINKQRRHCNCTDST